MLYFFYIIFISSFLCSFLYLVYLLAYDTRQRPTVDWSRGVDEGLACKKKKRKTKVWIGSEANSLIWRRIVKMEACMLAKAPLTKRWKKRHVPWLNVSLQDGYINMSNLFRQFSSYLLSVCKSCFKEHNRLHNHTYICITVHMGNSVRSVTNLSISNALVLGRNFYILFEIE